MNNQNFSTTMVVEQSPSDVFKAVNNVSAWWQGEIKGKSHHILDEFEYRMMDIHYSKQRIVEMIPDEKVVWLVTDSNLSSFKNKQEWNGTKITFDIKKLAEKKTQLSFSHLGLVPEFQCYGDCSNAWEQLIQQSLYSLITTGKGKNVF